MGKVMKTIAADDQAYARFDFADEAEVWLTFRFAFDADALAFWTTTNSNDFAQIANSSGAADANVNFIEQNPDPPEWGSNYPVSDAADTPVPTAGTWYEIELNYAADGTVNAYLDGALLFNLTPGVHEDVGRILLGQLDAISFDDASIVYIDDVKAGTTRGASDLFADGFEDGTFDAWTSTFGDVSIVDDPFPSETGFAAVPVFSVAFEDAALEPAPTWVQVG